ncbi:Slp family lipoprotein [Luteimonas sp. Sa2BVA3]|jgi:outer membrane lipoprotein|uniref:Slp family lipoprotein n=1 Tax=Luteimonas colneyensis TaxID=2762230 RepID=A0ABR8UGC6_9GAMM|nr:Slp family lipoprotein [Luteimonas colneyensis]MBD7987072.1 Slp family lipoprotein [Luteimonas colneyensis]
MRTTLLALAAVALLGACASQPKPLQGEYAALTPRDAAGTDATGSPVRWGGRIVQVEPRADSTCFEMVSTRLDHYGRPYWASDDTGGRFIACRAGFYDPAVFEVNREVTFTGRLAGHESRSIGGYSYRFPLVDADIVYLWPKRERSLITRPAPWPWWGYW